MKALLQRVSAAQVDINQDCVGKISGGLLVLLGLERGDDRQIADRLLKKLLAYRVFPDSMGRMNLSVADAGGGVLLVSQFTLAADTSKGLRPGFSEAMSPVPAEQLYLYFLEELRHAHPEVAAGVFGADMQIRLTNDGPVTFLLEA